MPKRHIALQLAGSANSIQVPIERIAYYFTTPDSAGSTTRIGLLSDQSDDDGHALTAEIDVEKIKKNLTDALQHNGARLNEATIFDSLERRADETRPQRIHINATLVDTSALPSGKKTHADLNQRYAIGFKPAESAFSDEIKAAANVPASPAHFIVSYNTARDFSLAPTSQICRSR